MGRRKISRAGERSRWGSAGDMTAASRGKLKGKGGGDVKAKRGGFPQRLKRGRRGRGRAIKLGEEGRGQGGKREGEENAERRTEVRE